MLVLPEEMATAPAAGPPLGLSLICTRLDLGTVEEEEEEAVEEEEVRRFRPVVCGVWSGDTWIMVRLRSGGGGNTGVVVAVEGAVAGLVT